MSADQAWPVSLGCYQQVVAKLVGSRDPGALGLVTWG